MYNSALASLAFQWSINVAQVLLRREQKPELPKENRRGTSS